MGRLELGSLDILGRTTTEYLLEEIYKDNQLVGLIRTDHTGNRITMLTQKSAVWVCGTWKVAFMTILEELTGR